MLTDYWYSGISMKSKPPYWQFPIGGFIVSAFTGRSKNSSLLNKLTFGANNSKIKNPKTDSDWISSDPVSVDIYKMDRMCGFVCSSGFMLNLYRLLGNIHKKRNMKKIPKELPVKTLLSN